MRERKIPVIVGIIIIIFGGIFHLQGQSMVGPESSFMYSNLDWITYGMEIIIAGIVIVGAGILILKKN